MDKKNKGGRPPVTFDYSEVEKLAALGCTDEEMGDFFGCSAETIRVNKNENQSFLDSYKKGKSNLKTSLRRAQVKSALEDGNTGMQIWLGKQLLGQSEKQEITGKDGGAIAFTSIDPKTLSKQEAITLEALVAKGTVTSTSQSN